MKPDLLPGIEEYLESIDYNFPINVKELEELTLILCARSGLPKKSAEILLRTFLSEMRNQIIKGNTVMLKRLGKMRAVCSKNNHVRVKFSPAKRITKKL